MQRDQSKDVLWSFTRVLSNKIQSSISLQPLKSNKKGDNLISFHFIIY